VRSYQKQEEIEKKLSLILVESLLNKTEKNYCVTRFLAIVESVKFFYHYLYGL